MFCERCELFWTQSFSRIQLPEIIYAYEDVRWVSNELILHHSLHDLKRAADRACILCRLIYSTPTEYEHKVLFNDHDEAIDVVLMIDPGNGSSLTVLAEFREGALGGVRLSKRPVASCNGLLDDNELAAALECCASSVNDHTGSEGAMHLAKFWVKRCVENHDKCRPLLSSDIAPFVPTRLLDLSNGIVRLVESKNIPIDVDRSYIALSHCWGLIPIIRTLKDNYKSHEKEIEPQSLSKTFSDAIHTTRQLGCRYLWIDSLCIVQDDSDDWSKEAQTMCDVYQCAMLTIAAAHAPGGDVGCFAQRDGLLQLPFIIELPQATYSGSAARLQFMSYGRVSETGGGSPALYGRAWVLQEQLLSPRMLIFDGIQLRWQCLAMHGSEGSPLAGISRHGRDYSEVRSGIMNEEEFFGNPRAPDLETFGEAWLSRLRHHNWCEITNEFTHRGMTKPRDRLIALAGIAKALNRHTKNTYMAGLWLDHFELGLLWSIPHLEDRIDPSRKGFDLEQSQSSRHHEEIAPSWSWASVTVPTMYLDMVFHHRICEVATVRVTGAMDRQTGEATIRGHTRRGYVNPIYPHYIKEAAKEYPDMMCPAPKGQLHLELARFKNRLFYPSFFFLFSESEPRSIASDRNPRGFSRTGPYRFVRGTFRPDEVIEHGEQVTFLAIAQRHNSSSLSDAGVSPKGNAALEVTTLVLVPTYKKPGEYRRVGLAIWEQCSWYGYRCKGETARAGPAEQIARPSNYNDAGFFFRDTWWDRLARKLWWKDLEMYEKRDEVHHPHSYTADELPDMSKYHPSIDVKEETIAIV